MLTGLRVDLEHYNIIQPNYITQPSPQFVVSNPAFANRVTRDPTTGLITLVDLSYLNATEYKTEGWDLKVNYQKLTTLGTLDFYALATMIEHDQRQYTIDGPLLNYVGFPAEGGEAKWKGTATIAWDYRHFKIGWTTTYFGSYKQFESPGSPLSIQFGPSTQYTQAQGGFTIPSQIYHDVFGSYTFEGGSRGRGLGTLLSNVAVQFGVKNLFNKLPPFDAYYQPYFYSPYGDPRLRNYRISIRKAF
jgi:iron complex outermembrane receptor protein